MIPAKAARQAAFLLRIPSKKQKTILLFNIIFTRYPLSLDGVFDVHI
jgi:hypothetical protein